MRFLLSLLLLLPSLALATPGHLERWAASVDGRDRAWLIYEPTSCPAEGCPVVFNLHGGGSQWDPSNPTASAERYLGLTGLQAVAEASNFILVAPNSWYSQCSGQTSWNYGDTLPSWLASRYTFRGTLRCPGVDVVDDVRFLSLLEDWVENNYPTDPSRTVSSGTSAGGAMSYRFACRSSVLEGIFITASSKHTDLCPGAAGVALEHYFGTADTNVPEAGNDTFPPIRQGVEFWAAENGCPPSTTTTLAQGTTRESWTPCAMADVAYIRDEGAGHTWAFQLDADPPTDTNEALVAFISGL